MRVHLAGEQRLRLDGVQLAITDESWAISSARSRTLDVSSSRMRRTSARSSSCSVTMSLFSSTAGSGSRKKAGTRAGAAVDDPRQLALLLGLEQQHVAVVARGG